GWAPATHGHLSPGPSWNGPRRPDPAPAGGARTPQPRLTSSVSGRITSPPWIGLLDHPQIHERLGLADPFDGAQSLRQEAQERFVGLADGLDQQAVRPRRDHAL